MRNTKRFVCLLLCVAFIAPIFTTTIYAWGRNWAPFIVCTIDADAMPEHTCFVEALFPMQEGDSRYCLYNDRNGELTGISSESEIVQLNVEGYQSFSFHDDSAFSDLEVKPGSGIEYVYFFTQMPVDWEYYYESCRLYRTMRLCYLDKDGNVLGISNSAPIYDEGMDGLKIETFGMKVEGKLDGDKLETKVWWDQSTWLDRTLSKLLIFFALTFPWSILGLLTLCGVGISLIIKRVKNRKRGETRRTD